MTTPVEKAVAAAQRGAELLDEIKPEWPYLILTNELVMQDSCNCILGQLYGQYMTGVKMLVENSEESSTPIVEDDVCYYGFDTRSDGSPPYWQDLDEAWAIQVNNRRK